MQNVIKCVVFVGFQVLFYIKEDSCIHPVLQNDLNLHLYKIQKTRKKKKQKDLGKTRKFRNKKVKKEGRKIYLEWGWMNQKKGFS